MSFPEDVKRTAKQKAHYACVFCQQKGVRLHVHHIVPQADGGSDSLENAAPLCPTCHNDYGDNPEARKTIRERRDWWWQRCEEKEEQPEVSRLYEEFEPLYERIDETYQEVQKGNQSLDDLRSAYLQLRDREREEISSASTVEEFESVVSSST